MQREPKRSPATVPFDWRDESGNLVSLKPYIDEGEVIHCQLLCARDPDNAVTITYFPDRSNNGNGHLYVSSVADPSSPIFVQTIACDVAYFAKRNRHRNALSVIYHGLRETLQCLRETGICDIPYAYDINDTVDDTLYTILIQFTHACLRMSMYNSMYYAAF